MNSPPAAYMAYVADDRADEENGMNRYQLEIISESDGAYMFICKTLYDAYIKLYMFRDAIYWEIVSVTT